MTFRVRRSMRTALVVLGILALIAGALHYVFNPRNLERYTAMELRLEKLRFMNRDLARRNRALAVEIEYCRHDPRYVERIARHELHQIREGDAVYVFGAPSPKDGHDQARHDDPPASSR